MAEHHAWVLALPPLHLTRAEFEALPEYSCSLPTGTTPGKRWRRHDGAHDREFVAAGGVPVWIIGEFDPDDDGQGSTIKINWFVPVPTIPAGGAKQ